MNITRDIAGLEQADIAMIALDHPDCNLRLEAVRRLRIQPVLELIALDGISGMVSIAAVENITSRERLIGIARSAQDKYVRLATIRSITNMPVIDASMQNLAILGGHTKKPYGQLFGVLAAGVIIDPSALIGEYVSIREDAQIGRDVFIGRGSSIGDGVTIEACVTLGRYVQIKNGAHLDAAVVICDMATARARTRIGDSAVIGPRTIIGEGAVIGRSAQIGSDVKVGNFAIIEENGNVENWSRIRDWAIVRTPKDPCRQDDRT